MLPWKPVHHRGKKREIPKENYYASQAFPSPPKSATIYSDSRDSTPPTLLQFWAFALIWNTQKRAQKEVPSSLTATAEILLLGGKRGIQGIAATPTKNPKDRSCTNTPKIPMFATHRTDVVSTQRKDGIAQRSRGNLIMSLEPSAPEFPHFGKGAWIPGTNSQEMHRVLTIEIFIQALFALHGWMRDLWGVTWRQIYFERASWYCWHSEVSEVYHLKPIPQEMTEQPNSLSPSPKARRSCPSSSLDPLQLSPVLSLFTQLWLDRIEKSRGRMRRQRRNSKAGPLSY